ncbi:hypothetical protein BDQ17DRAFT_1451609 [Cyathus striatus]|nr:hypothetical protein BDQ17DRAFT_1451609 [Cyathus striatus]
MHFIKAIEEWIKPLSEFRSTVAKFEAWWLSIFFQNITNEHKSEMLIELYNRIREESLVRSWKKLQRQHADYVFDVYLCISRYPKFLDLLDKIKKQRTNANEQDASYRVEEDQDDIQVINRSLYYGVSINAVFESIKVEKDTTQFVVEFQCDSSPKIKQLKILWEFANKKRDSSRTGPRVVNIAPMQCIGYVTKEDQIIGQKLEVPIGWNFLGFNVGATGAWRRTYQRQYNGGCLSSGTTRGRNAAGQ